MVANAVAETTIKPGFIETRYTFMRGKWKSCSSNETYKILFCFWFHFCCFSCFFVRWLENHTLVIRYCHVCQRHAVFPRWLHIVKDSKCNAAAGDWLRLERDVSGSRHRRCQRSPSSAADILWYVWRPLCHPGADGLRLLHTIVGGLRTPVEYPDMCRSVGEADQRPKGGVSQLILCHRKKARINKICSASHTCPAQDAGLQRASSLVMLLSRIRDNRFAFSTKPIFVHLAFEKCFAALYSSILRMLR